MSAGVWAGTVPDTTFLAVDADPDVTPVSVAGFTVFGAGVVGLVLHECVLGESGWRVSDTVTGRALTRPPSSSPEAALAQLEAMINRYGGRFGILMEGRRAGVLAAREAVSSNA